ncbi:MAG TPA: hypothetical protein VFH48_18195 [Chloroflexota bacterium]|nr:hypothetical protein [Chloroflexota bacterium]
MGTGPWRPRAGDRVRVRSGIGDTIPCAESTHYPEEAGKTGKVRREHDLAGTPAHRFMVTFDPPLPHVTLLGQELTLDARHYAAVELEPISEPQ